MRTRTLSVIMQAKKDQGHTGVGRRDDGGKERWDVVNQEHWSGVEERNNADALEDVPPVTFIDKF